MTNQYTLTGKVAAVLVCHSHEKGAFATVRQPQVTVTFDGFEGDRHSGQTLLSGGRTPHYPRGTEIKNDRQITLVSIEELAQIAARLGVPELQPEWLGANLLLQGLPRLTQLPPATRLFFAQGATLVIAQANAPCTTPGKVIRDYYYRPGLETLFPKAALYLRGLVAYVEKPGLIAEGDEVRAEVPQQVMYTPDEAK
jgi:MOSC domain-containing protein YiiM